MASYVVKIENKGFIRRLTLAKGEYEFSYEQLRNRIRDLFLLPESDQFVLTYIDKEGDVVTMAEDEDLKDALVLQALNPLRVTVANLQGGSNVKASSPILQNEANSDKVAEQQSAPIVQSPPSLSKSLPVQPVANAEPIVNSGEKVAEVEPVINSGDSSAIPEEISSKIDVAPNSNHSNASTSAAVGDAEKTPQEGATESESPEAEGAKEDCGRQIHFGIKCDGCRMIPIAGPRFKSCRKPNYDLCLKCFEASGAEENEYVKIERRFYRIGYPDYVGRMCGKPHEKMCRKPDQSPNSTAAPADANSTRVLHQGVQCDECGMVPIEGPRFKSSTRFNYDLCHSCFEKSKSNASEYSRIDRPVVRRGHPLVMRQLLRRASPYGLLSPLSGRWVWVLNQLVPVLAIDQVGAEDQRPAAGSDVKVGDPPQAESAAESTSNGTPAGTSPAQVDADATPSASKPEGTTEEPAVDAKLEKSNVVQIPVIDAKEADSDTGSAPETQTPVEVGNVTTDNGADNNSGTTAGVEEAVQAPAAEADLSTQEGLLAKLAAMGFEDPKLNAELLEKNDFDLRKTLDDLCAAEEWDPILGELQEMGFYDANRNRRLMFKNNGSVKRVVKELVQMYKGETQA